MDTPCVFGAHEKAGLAATWLQSGGQYTASELARRLGVHRSTALRLLRDLSRVLPLVEEEGHGWRWIRKAQ
jgi:DNA-binding IclR family transcriptional regulator